MKALLFKTGAETFALDFNQIQKVVESPQLYPIPLAPPFFQGALNFHNQIIPVLDLATYLDLFVQGRDSRLIILDLGQLHLALSVGSIENHVNLEDVKPLPCNSNSMVSSFSRLVASEDGQPIRILIPADLKNRLISDLRGKNGKTLFLSPSDPNGEERDKRSHDAGAPAIPLELSLSSGPSSGSR